MDDKETELREEEVIEINETSQNTTHIEGKHKSSFKRLIIRLFLFLLSIGILFSVIGFLWLGGYMNTWLCNTVQEESVLWDRFSCDGKTSVVDGNEDYSYEEKEDQNIMVTDLESVVTKVVSESSDSVVGIGIAGGTNAADRVIGSGFVVSSNGLIVTNQHVVSGGEAEDFFVVIGEDSDPIQVEKIYRDEVNDIALLKLAKTDLKVLPLGDSTKIKVGQTAIAIGNPLGSLSNTVTVGSISALNREVELSDDYYRFSSRTHFDVIQTDAAINPGNSGGPLLNSNGEVVGVNFATVSGADNLSFALPINLVKQRIQELNEFGDFRLPFLGVEYQRRLVFYKNEGVVGAIVMNVVENSPAAKAGIVEGDVIVQFAGKDLEDESLLNLIQRAKIGEEVEVVIIRDGESQTIKVVIADRNEFN
ncbi:trypsin-like peptidase domain-containing protein [Candidatus Dojkabacteria bacterium]|uniref:Trypsin-like peptidase domain-containing protein n=1 Tax=Candidatus Dojkabacteria bacterium TaxID=2099670 RepID=A0A955L1G1_9BACT|nr:trypsin-like peptidase domain-containing protein [Candidatus Dojkabacteria bacterium]